MSDSRGDSSKSLGEIIKEANQQSKEKAKKNIEERNQAMADMRQKGKDIRTLNRYISDIKRFQKHNTDKAMTILEKAISELSGLYKDPTYMHLIINVRKEILGYELRKLMTDKINTLSDNMPEKNQKKVDKYNEKGEKRPKLEILKEEREIAADASRQIKKFRDVNRKISTLCKLRDEEHIQEAESELDSMLESLQEEYQDVNRRELIETCKLSIERVLEAKREITMIEFEMNLKYPD